MSAWTVSIDANILVYSHAEGDRRQQRSLAVLERAAWHGVVLSGQVLGEFIAASRKFGLRRDRAVEVAQHFRRLGRLVFAGGEEFEEATAAFRDHGLQFFDALLWATVRSAGVTHLLSEDFQDGRSLGGVTFVNPFNEANMGLVDRLLPPVQP